LKQLTLKSTDQKAYPSKEASHHFGNKIPAVLERAIGTKDLNCQNS